MQCTEIKIGQLVNIMIFMLVFKAFCISTTAIVKSSYGISHSKSRNYCCIRNMTLDISVVKVMILEYFCW